jgi:predicted transcriptional regulator
MPKLEDLFDIKGTSNPVSGRTGVRANDAKWTPRVMKAGYVLIPTVLLDRQRALGLDATDMNILLHIVRHWWYQERLPYPAKRTIAECMEISESTIRRRIADMEKRQIIKRITRRSKDQGQQSNQYDLSGLVEILKPFAEEALDIRRKREGEDSATRRRKRFLRENKA